ncbi:MAG TPA: hypothetical protein VIJ14_10040 [Rhabdochlamydiaceae bacterium]
MSVSRIDLNSLPHQVNFHRDIHEKKSHIFLGTFAELPTDHELQQETIRELVIKANFESQDALYALGNVCVYTKKSLASNDWQVIETTVKAFCSKLGTKLGTSVALIVGIPATILLGYPLGLSAVLIYLTIDLSFTLLSVIEHIQKMNQDQFVVFQNLSARSNSMNGIYSYEIRNSLSRDGWIDCLTGNAISQDKIFSTQILRFGSYALPIKSALQSMLKSTYQGSDFPLGQIPHPIDPRPLDPRERDKFLNEVSAFFDIKDRAQLEACWNMRIRKEEITSYVSELRYWDNLSNEAQNEIKDFIALQILCKKQVEAFLSLLTDSIAQTYFDNDFLLNTIVSPIIYPDQTQFVVQKTLVAIGHAAPAA